jgi:hypothetical protein
MKKLVCPSTFLLYSIFDIIIKTNFTLCFSRAATARAYRYRPRSYRDYRVVTCRGGSRGRPFTLVQSQI